jgi:hypothetical protein
MGFVDSMKSFYQNHTIGIFTLLALAVYAGLWFAFSAKLDKKLPQTYHGIADLVWILVPFVIVLMSFFFLRRKNLFPRGDKSAPSIFGYLAKIGSITGIAMFFAFVIFAIFWIIKEYKSADDIIKIVLDILFILVGIAILYKAVSHYIRVPSWKMPAGLRLIKEVILYIPCLILSLVSWIKLQYNITSKPVWILLAVEIAIIGLRFLLPWLLEKILNHEGILLLKNPIYLNNENTVGSFDTLHKERLSKLAIEEKGPFNYNYAISGWFYINPQPPSTSTAYSKDTVLLTYGGKPAIKYNARKDMMKVTLIQDLGATIDDDKKEIVLAENIKLPLQKWNNIVLNMKGGMLDIFLNGELIASGPDTMTHMSYDNLTVGAPNGIEGAVCNVRYFKNPLSLAQISLQYNTYKNLTPPIA